MLNQILQIGDIKKVIWIDDTFSKESHEERDAISVKDVVDEIRVLLESGDTEPLERVNQEYNLGEDFDFEHVAETVHQYKETLEGMDSNLLRSIALNLDIVNEQENKVITLFEQTDLEVKKFSFREWDKECKKEDGSEDISDTLFLVDKDFSKEGESEDKGLEIAKSILQRVGSYDRTQCVIFTQDVGATEKDENEARKLFLTQYQLGAGEASGRLMVLAKSRVSDPENAENSLAIGLRNSFIRTLLWATAKGVIDHSVSASTKTLEKISDANIYQVSSVLFDSSGKEGGLEIDVIHRIISAEWQDSAANFLLATPAIKALIGKGRELYDCNPVGQAGSDENKLESSKELLSTIRKAELWYNGDIVNQMFSPLANGDVFELTETKQQFILICQPCELMIRGDGSRTVYDAVLLPLNFRKIKPKKVDDFKAKRRPEIYSFYESISTVVDKGAYSVELNKPTTVNLSFLDLCCFNEDGALMLNKATMPHSALLTKGLKTRFEKYQKLVLEKTAKEIKKSALGNLINFPTPLFAKDSSLLSGVTLTQRKGCVSAPIRRINRVRDALAEEILADFYRYKARKAWGADFLGEVQ